jgi:radical SAM superfamily enzyme YgiQ (UPF0313 family)
MSMKQNSAITTKVLLVGIYDRTTVSLAPQLLRSYAEQFPIAAQFEIETVEFSIFSDTPDAMATAISSYHADIVGFSAYVWNLEEILAIAPYLDSTVIIGGPQVTGIERPLLENNPALDIVVTGEGEVTFVELLEHFAGQRPLESIDGITTRLLKTTARELLPELDNRPSPYRRIFNEHPDLSWISYESSRGCPFMCGYCTWGYSRQMRYHSEQRVLDDLRLILTQESIRSIYFCDSSLLLQKERAKRILRFLVEQQCDKEIRFEFDAQQLDDELIDLMAQLPGDEFNFGLQSINPQALAIAGRKFDPVRFEENYRKVVQRLPGANITIDLIYGLPGDSYTGYLDSLDYVIRLDKVRRILTNPLIALPGSRFFSEMEQHGLQLAGGTSYLVTCSNSFSAEDMHKARKASLYVSLLYMNSKLLDAVRREAARLGERPVDFIIRLFAHLQLLDSNSPDMVPTSIAGFRARNATLAATLKRYDELVCAFNHVAATPLSNYHDAFTDQYHKALARAAEMEKSSD